MRFYAPFYLSYIFQRTLTTSVGQVPGAQGSTPAVNAYQAQPTQASRLGPPGPQQNYGAAPTSQYGGIPAFGPTGQSSAPYPQLVQETLYGTPQVNLPPSVMHLPEEQKVIGLFAQKEIPELYVGVGAYYACTFPYSCAAARIAACRERDVHADCTHHVSFFEGSIRLSSSLETTTWCVRHPRTKTDRSLQELSGTKLPRRQSYGGVSFYISSATVH